MQLEFKTKGENDILNITAEIQDSLAQSKTKEGFVLLFLQSSTSSLAIMEYEDGLLKDIPNSLNRLAPTSGEYEHEKAWHDGNGHSHVRSSLLGVNLSVPFGNRKLLLGTWQQIVLMEFDVRPRKRDVIMQIVSG